MHTRHELTYALDVSRLRLRAARLYRGDSQQLWAGIIHVHRPAFTLIERGRQRLHPIQLLALLDIMGGDPRWYLGMDLWYDAGYVAAPTWWASPRREWADEWQEVNRLVAEYRARGKKPTKKGGDK